MARGLLGFLFGMQGHPHCGGAVLRGPLPGVGAAVHPHPDKGELQELTLTRQGRSVKLLALRDTGNTLQDPLTGRARGGGGGGEAPPSPAGTAPAGPAEPGPPVELLRDLEGTAGDLRLQLLPYRAVGVECGLLLALQGWTGPTAAAGKSGTASPPSLPPRCRTAGGTAPLIGGEGREHTMTGGMGMKKTVGPLALGPGRVAGPPPAVAAGKAHVHRGQRRAASP